MAGKKTLVLGASPDPERYSNRAVKKLRAYGHEVVAVAKRKSQIDDVEILDRFPADENIDTVTIYLGPQNQPEYYDQILKLHPKRIIFNPGAENLELESLAEKAHIEVQEACTLVLLATGQF